MPDAYIFDHVRTPRGKGKKDGSLHEVTPIRLATQMLEAIRDRNKGLDTSSKM
jgi:acetyl-CoA C-acetyltransferase